jgi:hypothetical protein
MAVQTKEIKLSSSDVRRIVRQENSRSKGLWIFTLVSLVVVLALSIYGYYLREDFVILRAWLPYLGVVLLWWLFFLVFVPWCVVRSKNLKRLTIPVRITFSGHVIRQECADGATKEVPLTSISKATVRSEYAIIYDQDGSIIILPFHAFHNAEEAQQIRLLLSSPNALLHTDATPP